MNSRLASLLTAASLAAGIAGACNGAAPADGAGAAGSGEAVASASAPEPELPPGKTRAATPSRRGGAVARSVDGKRLYVADEDRSAVHVLELGVSAAAPGVADGAKPAPIARVSRPG